MPSFNLTATQLQIVVSWLYEDQGYLDGAVNNQGVSARDALNATPGLNVTQWIRDNTKGPAVDPEYWNGCAMVWWIRANDQVNITPNQRPPESTAWVAKLNEWDASIDAGFARVPQNERNTRTVPITDINGTVTTMPAGSHLAQQQGMFNQVIPVLGG